MPITRATLFAGLLAERPSFAATWNSWREFGWWSDEDPNGDAELGRFAELLADRVRRGDTAEFAAVFAHVERWCIDGDEHVRSKVTRALLGAVQILLGHEPAHLSVVERFLGPEGRQRWDSLRLGWASAPDCTRLMGSVFKHGSTKGTFGILREWDPTDGYPEGLGALAVRGWSPCAEDGGGNLLVRSMSETIGCWDHETDTVTKLAGSWAEFVAGCGPPSPMPKFKVLSVWVDPSFAKQQGLQVPADGWMKRRASPCRPYRPRWWMIVLAVLAWFALDACLPRTTPSFLHALAEGGFVFCAIRFDMHLHRRRCATTVART